MKLTRVSLIAPIVMLMAACSDDAPRGGAPTEDYVRAFVREFGVPAKGHDFSQARSAGLKVKASRPTHITVTAEIEGEEYLFGDLNVPAGLTAIPVTIPSDVQNLNIHIGMANYSVPADGIVDLERLPESSSDSRYIDISISSYYPNASKEISDGKTYYFPFKYDDILKPYFKQFPRGVDKPSCGYAADWLADKWAFECETIFGTWDDVKSAGYYIFPIFRDTKENGMLGWSIAGAVNCNTHTISNLYNNYFNTPRYSNLYNDISEIDFSDLSKFNNNSGYGESFPTTDGDNNFMVVSEGQYVRDNQTDYGIWINLIYMEKVNNAGHRLYSSSNPQINYQQWDDNYFHATLGNLQDAYGSTRRVMWRCPVNGFSVYCYDSKTKSTSEIKINRDAYIIGFNTPPNQSNDKSTVRDYADALFLVFPAQSITADWHYLPMNYKKYYWTIAVEDLGGSFDWDFNDAVFRFTDVVENIGTVQETAGGFARWTPKDAVSVRKISVEPLAAGGTMPLYITYTGKVYADPEISSDADTDYYTANEKLRAHMSATAHEGTYIIGAEIHKWLGGSTHTKMLNTNGTTDFAPGKKITFAIPTDKDPSDTYWSSSNNVSSSNQPLMGFAVLVDKENKLDIDTRTGAGFEALPEYTLGQDTYLIGRPDENEDNIAPQMILIAGNDWEWPQECVNIKDAYPKFADWLKTISYEKWQNTKNSDKVTKRQ